MLDNVIRILFVGDIVGSSGIRVIRNTVPGLKKDRTIDLCIVNGENAANGLGITGPLAQKLYRCGVDCITLGNHTWSKWEIAKWIEQDLRMARPANGHVNWPGRGFVLLEHEGVKIGVLNLLGNVFLNAPSAAFSEAEHMVDFLRDAHGARIILVDFHAEATSEKQAMGHYLDGKVTAVIGTHTHVQTSDERLLPRGTAYITDVGMCGAVNGVIGMTLNSSLRRFVECLPSRYEPAKGTASMNAVLLSIDKESGEALSIERYNVQESENMHKPEQTLDGSESNNS
ncbi:MAG: TIGR00282 family metallophosphoesterase [Fastidiosipilaceae bacterium]